MMNSWHIFCSERTWNFDRTPEYFLLVLLITCHDRLTSTGKFKVAFLGEKSAKTEQLKVTLHHLSSFLYIDKKKHLCKEVYLGRPYMYLYKFSSACQMFQSRNLPLFILY